MNSVEALPLNPVALGSLCEKFCLEAQVHLTLAFTFVAEVRLVREVKPT
tara:strand:- start:4675 stop:4821 length:147 start_codon:yes stop_codon:yes gene_type:complete